MASALLVGPAVGKYWTNYVNMSQKNNDDSIFAHGKPNDSRERVDYTNIFEQIWGCL